MKHAEQNSDVHQYKYIFLFNISHRSYKFMILKRTEESNEKMRQKINNFLIRKIYRLKLKSVWHPPLTRAGNRERVLCS